MLFSFHVVGDIHAHDGKRNVAYFETTFLFGLAKERSKPRKERSKNLKERSEISKERSEFRKERSKSRERWWTWHESRWTKERSFVHTEEETCWMYEMWWDGKGT
jgi:hypothetical protein